MISNVGENTTPSRVLTCSSLARCTYGNLPECFPRLRSNSSCRRSIAFHSVAAVELNSRATPLSPASLTRRRKIECAIPCVEFQQWVTADTSAFTYAHDECSMSICAAAGYRAVAFRLAGIRPAILMIAEVRKPARRQAFASTRYVCASFRLSRRSRRSPWLGRQPQLTIRGARRWAWTRICSNSRCCGIRRCFFLAMVMLLDCDAAQAIVPQQNLERLAQRADRLDLWLRPECEREDRSLLR